MPERDSDDKQYDSYFRLFRGGMSLLSQIEKENPLMIKAVEILLKDGLIIGQAAFTDTGEKDLLLFMPQKRPKNL